MISLNEISLMARSLVEAEAEVLRAEERLKTLKETARILREETIPSAMDELGLTSIKLDTGETLTIKQDVFASIPADRRAEAYSWLEEHGFGGLIKVDVTTPFGRGDLDKARALAERLRADGIETTMEEVVHPQTLKAFLREQLQAGANVPLELFGARPVNTTKVK